MSTANNDPNLHLTHLDEQGNAKMVDVGDKDVTSREAIARGHVSIQPETLRLIKEGLMKKGDVLTIAQLAGIMGAKKNIRPDSSLSSIAVRQSRCGIRIGRSRMQD